MSRTKHFNYQNTLSQVREARENYYEENRDEFFQPLKKVEDEILALRQAGEDIPEELEERRMAAKTAWQAFFKENDPDSYRSAAEERSRYKKKSKKVLSAKIEIIDHEALSEVTFKEPTVEWSADFKPGSLVETKNGDMGLVVAEHDEKYRGKKKTNRPSWIKRGMEDSYVKLLVNGVEEWHKKFSVSPLDD